MSQQSATNEVRALGRTVVVTGGSAGVGRAVAREFASKGWRVAILARGNEGLLGTKTEIEEMGGQALTIEVDVSLPEKVEAAAAQIEREWGHIDVWVNNAMVTVFSEFDDATPDEIRRATEVTYLGTVWGTRAALSRMRKRNRGVIVQVGSALAYRSIPLQSAYCGAKSAIRGFTDALRSELIHQQSGIQLTMVQLSAFNTPQFDWAENHMRSRAQPVPPVFQPEVAARAIYHAAIRPRRELWVGWPAVKTILAQRLLPGGWLDRLASERCYSGQVTGEPLPSSQKSNLFSPVDGDPGARGRFGSARQFSVQNLLNTHRAGVATVAAAAVGLILLSLRARERRLSVRAGDLLS